MFRQISHGYFHKENYTPMMKRSTVNFKKVQDIESVE